MFSSEGNVLFSSFYWRLHDGNGFEKRNCRALNLSLRPFFDGLIWLFSIRTMTNDDGSFPNSMRTKGSTFVFSR